MSMFNNKLGFISGLVTGLVTGFFISGSLVRFIHIKKREIKKLSTIELRNKFDNDGYVFLKDQLVTLNTEMNEITELMRKTDSLAILNGCYDLNNCECNFRYKNCRLFMLRKYSNSDNIQYFAPSCNNVIDVTPGSFVDIKTINDEINYLPINKFIQLSKNRLNRIVNDLINYIRYIINADEERHYVTDITFITEYNTDKDNEDDNKKYTLMWHQDKFVESKTRKCMSYDYVGVFVLNTKNLTPHKLMIGKTISNDSEEKIVLVNETNIDNENISDIGYIIDQTKDYYHKHSDYEHMTVDGIRNIITIKFKYMN